MQLSDDYGRPDPLDLAEYEFFSLAVCSRTPADTWTCQEEELAALAKKHNVALPNDRAGRNAAAEKLLELVLASRPPRHRDTEPQDPRRPFGLGATQARDSCVTQRRTWRASVCGSIYAAP